jgi:thiol-disulfide isomerase/thioredoxin
VLVGTSRRSYLLTRADTRAAAKVLSLASSPPPPAPSADSDPQIRMLTAAAFLAPAVLAPSALRPRAHSAYVRRSAPAAVAAPTRPPGLEPLSSTPPPSSSPPLPPTPLTGRRSLAAFIARSSADLVVVYFRARFCRSCATLAPKVARVAAQVRDAAPGGAYAIDWVSIDVVDGGEENRMLASEGAVVTMLPTFHFYRGGRGACGWLGGVDGNADDGRDGELEGANEDEQRLADRALIDRAFVRSFIAGPFGARRLQDNLAEVLVRESCSLEEPKAGDA